MLDRKAIVAAAAVALCGAGWAQGALVNDWKGDNYTSGSWTDSVGSVIATANGTPTSVAAGSAGFNGHKGVAFNGNSNFVVTPAGTTAPANSTTYTLAAVYKATANGADNNGGAAWGGSGLIGDEEGGSGPAGFGDFGLALVGAKIAGFQGAPTQDSVGAATTLNTVHAVAFVVDSTAGTIATYQDGVLLQTVNAAGPYNPRSQTGFALGAVTTGGVNQFPGSVAELQTYNTAENGVTLTNSLLAVYAPEPASLGLLGFGALGLLARRRRQPA